MGAFLSDQLSRHKHPESYEIVGFSSRDDSGKVRHTLPRDERATWLKEGRDFRIGLSVGSKAGVKSAASKSRAKHDAGSPRWSARP
jgi:bile acid-coenzyme A ligase